MNTYSSFESPHAQKLHEAGHELVRLTEDEVYSHDFGDASVEVEIILKKPPHESKIFATVDIGTAAVAGFGAMIGKTEELLTIFPEGAKFDLLVPTKYEGRIVNVWMTGVQWDMKIWGGTYTDLKDGVIKIGENPWPKSNFSDEELEALSSIDKEAVLASAGSYVVSLADRAHTLIFAEQ